MGNYGNKFRKVQSGERREIPAALWNEVLSAVEYIQSLRDMGGALVGRNQGRLCVVPVKNTTNADRARWEVMGLGDVLYTPTDAQEEFLNQPILKGETPALADHLGKFCILAEPLGPNDVGWGVVAGVVPVKLSLANDVLCDYADIDGGIATSLKCRSYGAAQVLWRADGTGEQWGVVRLGNPAGRSYGGMHGVASGSSTQNWVDVVFQSWADVDPHTADIAATPSAGTLTFASAGDYRIRGEVHIVNVIAGDWILLNQLKLVRVRGGQEYDLPPTMKQHGHCQSGSGSTYYSYLGVTRNVAIQAGDAIKMKFCGDYGEVEGASLTAGLA